MNKSTLEMVSAFKKGVRDGKVGRFDLGEEYDWGTNAQYWAGLRKGLYIFLLQRNYSPS